MTRRGALVLLVMLAAGIGVLARPPIPQDPAYHAMADRRVLFGIPNALNVLSNAAFAIAGLVGLAATFRRSDGPARFGDPWVRWPYAAVFGGTVLTAIGSSHYHLAPDDTRLIWDRLPMTLVFMGLLAAVTAERLSARLSRLVFGPQLALGAASVGYWYWSELQGAGDLRPYVLVQFGSLLGVVLLLIATPGNRRDTTFLVAGLLAYAVAKVLEWADQPIFAVLDVVSGHTLKHIAAAAGVGCVAAMLVGRRGRAPTPGSA
jgi:hypothetical protein